MDPVGALIYRSFMHLRIILLCCVLAMVWVSPAFAQNMTRIQALAFGTFALKNNNAQHNLQVTRTNVVIPDSAFVPIINPTRAEYRLEGFPANTPFTATITDTTLTLNGAGGNHFDVRNFTPGLGLQTDSSGNADLRFGATLTTSGTGVMYTDGFYTGTIDVTVNY